MLVLHILTSGRLRTYMFHSFIHFQPFCAVFDIIYTFEYYQRSRVPGRRRSIFRMFTAKPDFLKRIIYLAGITFFLAIIRFSAMNFEFPTFNMEENPIANHPSFLVRVSVIPESYQHCQINQFNLFGYFSSIGAHLSVH